MIPKFTIARIIEDARIEDIVGEFVTLKKRGANLLGNCPFHNEKTPSFTVSPTKGIYKCFGCGKAGNSVNFLMEYQQLSYVEALRYLAKKYNIEIEEATEEQNKEEQLKQSHTESILIANQFAQKYFSDYLFNTEEGRVGLAYFRERGFNEQIIQQFQLGYSPSGYTTFTEHALKSGYQLDILRDAGLVSVKEEGKRFDFFRNRVMFPVLNITGKVIAFGGRIMVKDEKSPKYINTSESEVYQKSKILYGIFFAKNAIKKQDECLLVEGYTDVISLVQAGIENPVASSGTSLTVDQIKLIKRLTKNITILYDGDFAGIKAALRGTDMVLEEGMNVRIVLLPDGEDPDSYVRKTGCDGFLKYIKDNKKDLILFKTGLFAEESKRDPIRKSELIRDIVESISKIPDPIQRMVYVKECSQLMDIQEQILIVEVNKYRRNRVKKEQEQNEAAQQQGNSIDVLPHEFHQEQMQETSPTLDVLERDLLRVLLEYGNWEIPMDENQSVSVTAHVLEELEGVQFEHPEYKQVYGLIQDEFTNGNVHAPDFFTNNENETVRTLAIDLLASRYEMSDNWWTKMKVTLPEKRKTFTKDMESAIIRLKQYKNLQLLKQVDEKIKAATEEEELLKLIGMKKILLQQKKEFSQQSGTVVYKPNF